MQESWWCLVWVCLGLAGCSGASTPPPSFSDAAWGDLTPQGQDVDLVVTDSSVADHGPDSPSRVPDGPPARPYTFYRINHILSTGQSLAVGDQGCPALSTTQPFSNLMFNTGVLAGGTGLSTFVPLVEIEVETMSSGLANLVSQLARQEVFKGAAPPEDSHDVLVSCSGMGGAAYTELKQGTIPFLQGLAQVKAAKQISETLGHTYVVRALTVVHGEADHSLDNTTYGLDLIAWQADYEKEVCAITGQTEPVPMLQTQVSSWTAYGDETSVIPGAQLAASVNKPTKIVLVGPKYFLPYCSDGVHLTAEGYREMGEHYAKVYRRLVLEGKGWEPLRPTGVTRKGAVITISFHVPSPPLVLDTQRVSDPGDMGFEYWDSSPVSPPITSVALDGPTRVRITLAEVPTAQVKRIRYAWRGKPGNSAGPLSGPRGNLRDSDATPSRHGYKLYNWAIHFEHPVP
jgi:hypothetical protein